MTDRVRKGETVHVSLRALVSLLNKYKSPFPRWLITSVKSVQDTPCLPYDLHIFTMAGYMYNQMLFVSSSDRHPNMALHYYHGSCRHSLHQHCKYADLFVFIVGGKGWKFSSLIGWLLWMTSHPLKYKRAKVGFEHATSLVKGSLLTLTESILWASAI